MTTEQLTVWQTWERATNYHRGSIVVGLIPGYGTFDIRQGIIYRMFDVTRKDVRTARPAAPDELAELDWAAKHGCLQLEIRPPTGVFHGQAGFGTAAAAENPIITIWQANGKIAKKD